MRAIALALVAVLAACDSDSDTDADASSGAFQLVCESGGTTFPTLDKACSAPSDCFIAAHMMNCCGTRVAIGLNVSSQSAFTAAETACSNAYPACGCAELPMQAEDGRREDMGTIQVDCRDQRCFTYVP